MVLIARAEAPIFPGWVGSNKINLIFNFTKSQLFPDKVEQLVQKFCYSTHYSFSVFA
jgi:hypothetical protein